MSQFFTIIGVCSCIAFTLKLCDNSIGYIKKFFKWLIPFIKSKFKKGGINNG